MAGDTTVAKAQAASTDKKEAPSTVIVACKLPQGLRLQDFDVSTQVLPVMGGGTRTEKVATRISEGFLVKGPAHQQNEGPRAPIITGTGYALTFGCPKDLWERWHAAFKNSPFVTNNLIFAYESPEMVEGHAREYAAQQSGLERLDPKDPARRIAPFSAGAPKATA